MNELFTQELLKELQEANASNWATFWAANKEDK